MPPTHACAKGVKHQICSHINVGYFCKLLLSAFCQKATFISANFVKTDFRMCHWKQLMHVLGMYFI